MSCLAFKCKCNVKTPIEFLLSKKSPRKTIARTIKFEEIGKKSLKTDKNWQKFVQIYSILWKKKQLKVNTNQIARQPKVLEEPILTTTHSKRYQNSMEDRKIAENA